MKKPRAGIILEESGERRGKGKYMKLAFCDYREKVLGCMYGKTIGGTLGAPFECYRGVFDVGFYTQSASRPVPNDDVDLQLVWLRAVELEGRNINAHVLAEYWSTYVSASLAEYGTGKNNFRMGIRPPLSGHLRNRNRNSNGAWIRTEIWACLAAGHPEIAVRYALEDSMVDHSGEGVYSAVFVAAVQAAAFAENDIFKLIDIGLSYIPADCGVAKGVKTVLGCYENGMDWKAARKTLFQTVPGSFGMMNGYYPGQVPEEDIPAGEPGYDAPSNIGIVIIGLLYGGGDFGRSICTAVNCGEDTDCTAGTLGALLGIMLGAENIPEKWKNGCSDEIVTWCLRKDEALKAPRTVAEFADRILRQTPAVLTDYCDIAAANGYTIDIPEKTEEEFVPRFWNTFPYLLSRIPRATHDVFPICDVFVAYDEDFVSLRAGRKKTLSVRFVNKLLDPQYLTVKLLGVSEDFEVEDGAERCVGLEHRHGGRFTADLRFCFTPVSLKKAKYEFTMEIKSEGRMAKYYIPLVFLNGNCTEADE